MSALGAENMAHLDKSRNRVLCYKCHRDIAMVLTDPWSCRAENPCSESTPLTGIRVLGFDMGWQVRSDGTWALTDRAITRLKAGKRPTVRRQWRPVSQALNDEIEPPTQRPFDESYRRLEQVFHDLRFVRIVRLFPCQAHCWRCHVLQTLDPVRLDVTDVWRASQNTRLLGARWILNDKIIEDKDIDPEIMALIERAQYGSGLPLPEFIDTTERPSSTLMISNMEFTNLGRNVEKC